MGAGDASISKGGVSSKPTRSPLLPARFADHQAAWNQHQEPKEKKERQAQPGEEVPIGPTARALGARGIATLVIGELDITRLQRPVLRQQIAHDRRVLERHLHLHPTAGNRLEPVDRDDVLVHDDSVETAPPQCAAQQVRVVPVEESGYGRHLAPVALRLASARFPRSMRNQPCSTLRAKLDAVDVLLRVAHWVGVGSLEIRAIHAGSPQRLTAFRGDSSGGSAIASIEDCSMGADDPLPSPAWLLWRLTRARGWISCDSKSDDDCNVDGHRDSVFESRLIAPPADSFEC